MNARELHDNWIDIDDTNRALLASDPENGDLILCALDRMARVEESGDGLARELKELHQLSELPQIEEAAALIVALQAERDKLKAHAEYMRLVLDWLDSQGGLGYDKHREIRKVIDAYRRDFPKEDK